MREYVLFYTHPTCKLVLNFKNIKFNYPNSKKEVLDIQDLEIKKNIFGLESFFSPSREANKNC